MAVPVRTAGAATVEGTPSRLTAVATTLTGTAAADFVPVILAAASFSGSGQSQVTANPSQLLAAESSLSGAATVYADGLALTGSTTLVLGGATITANATIVRAAAATLTGTASVQAQGNSAFLQLVTRPGVRLVYAAEIQMWAVSDRIAA